MNASVRRLLFYGPIARSVRAGQAFLGRAGFQVFVGEKGAQFLEGIGRLQPEMCVLALDIPDVPGDEIVAAIKKTLGPRAPAFLLVCEDDDAQARRCEAAGVNAFLRAPWTREELLQAAAKILAIPPRSSKRVLVGIDVKPTTRDRDLVFGTLANLSAGGTLLQTNEGLPEGTKLGLSFSLPGQSHVINCSGVIVRHEDSNRGIHGYGVRFEQIAESDVQRITAFVDSQ